jgi:hypothetical protein
MRVREISQTALTCHRILALLPRPLYLALKLVKEKRREEVALSHYNYVYFKDVVYYKIQIFKRTDDALFGSCKTPKGSEVDRSL